MSVAALLGQYVTINATNLSDHMKGATLTVDVAQLDPTAMGDGWVKVAGGLKSAGLQIEWLDDVAAASVDATLWPLLGTVVAFEFRLDSAAVGTSNPKYTGSVFIGQHMIGGGIGELPMKNPTYPTSGPVVRATS